MEKILTDGRFGQALLSQNNAMVWVEAESIEAYGKMPLTVECWAKLENRNGYNILVSHDLKESGGHWEIYSYMHSGCFCACLPGYVPAEIISERPIVDGQWHYLAMVFDGCCVRLYMDGEQVAEKEIKREPRIAAVGGPLMVGRVASRVLPYGCEGAIDSVRISNSLRKINSVPDKAFAVEEDTVGLWDFNSQVDDAFADASTNNNSLIVQRPEKISLDEVDRRSYAAGPSPLDSAAVKVILSKNTVQHDQGVVSLALDGQWQMAEEGDDATRLAGHWDDVIDAAVPGSVHTALWQAGKIPDPYVGVNDEIARANSRKTWWFKKTFKRPKGIEEAELQFDGVAVRGTFWLNGTLLGSHEGMFGGPYYDVSELLQEHNTLIVKIDPAPYRIGKKEDLFFNDLNIGWRDTVVFNNVYGWHYSDIPSLGIWRSVRLEAKPAVSIKNPFLSTHDIDTGEVDLVVALEGNAGGFTGVLHGSIEPENFEGEVYSFEHKVESNKANCDLHLRFAVPDPQLWWPNDMGEPNLYRLKLSFGSDFSETTFGIRSLEMRPLPGGPFPYKFDWTFVINDRPMFVKGNGWCTMDPLMNFSRQRIERLVSLAADQHIQMFRAWGSGMPETDDFFDLCDRYGIMVLQEWPTAWNSHLDQPYDILEETVRLNTLRLRNHPSLVMWGGGNESDNPYGKAIDMMGRYAIELDGTRPFHRGEPFGGSLHNYNCWWGKQPLDNNLTMTSDFFGEFGLASLPVYESVQRYLPEDEKDLWPAPDDRSFAHHTPVFNKMEDMDRLRQYAAYFTAGKTMERFCVASQLAQAVGVRHTLERARTRWPDCSGALYYKMNDNYPAASWACVDWYGAAKIGHFIFQDAFAPLHGCLLFEEINSQGKSLSLPVWLLDDTDALKGSSWKVVVRAYDGDLAEVARQEYAGNNSIERTRQVGVFELSAKQTDSTPLFTVVDVFKNNESVDRTFYWTNYEAKKDCLFELPEAKLTLNTENGSVIVSNQGSLPAVAVCVACPGKAAELRILDNYFWLDPGEAKKVSVNFAEGLTVDSWNRDDRM